MLDPIAQGKRAEPARLHLVLYGVGSSLAVDVEETCLRAGIDILAGVHNVEGPSYVSGAVRVIAPAELTDAERSCGFVTALFTPGYRRRAVEEALRAGFSHAATLVDPTAVVARSTAVGAGVYINAGVVMGGACWLADYVLVNRGANIGHHVRIDDYASIGPGAVLLGMVSVGRGAVVGGGSVVLPQVVIGDNAVIGAGCVVQENVPSCALVVGNPGRVMRIGVSGYKDMSI